MMMMMIMMMMMMMMMMMTMMRTTTIAARRRLNPPYHARLPRTFRTASTGTKTVHQITSQPPAVRRILRLDAPASYDSAPLLPRIAVGVEGGG
jgi:hypothetical protein